MLAGPIFTREALTSPRQTKHFLLRAGYIAALFILMYTAGQATFGWQQVRNIGEVSRFGTLLFQMFSIVQLTLCAFFALLFSAGNVAQEKDRETLILLLMTDLRRRELVWGKLSASLLIVAVLLAASVPVFFLVHSLGGVSLNQISWSLAICAVSALAAGSWGNLVAFWREKTFQTLAISVLGLVLYLGLTEAVVQFAGSQTTIGEVVGYFNPYRALFQLLDPLGDNIEVGVATVSSLRPVLAILSVAVVLNVITILKLRVWNPPRAVYVTANEDDEESTVKRKKTRNVWSNPVVWREIRTLAYGRKIFLIKIACALLALFAAVSLWNTPVDAPQVLGMVSPLGFAFIGLGLMSLILVNAQSGTSLTTERDGKTLELFLMTDVTAKEFVFGKLGGVFYNTKEVILIPLVLVGVFVARGDVSIENMIYLAIGFLVLTAFSAMLGLHAGLSYENSRSAISNSLGTIFFLFIGIFIFMILLVEARSSFWLQLPSFIVFIGFGAIGLHLSLSHSNPSPALRIAAGILPFLTFYSITEFLLSGSLGVCFSISAAYGFATFAMLIPAISEFDVALGRTTLDKG